VKLDVPDEIRRKVVADGNAAWLDELPSVVESLVQDWSLTIGGTFRGGHAAFVVEATLADGTAAVLKVGVPGIRRELGYEAAVLRLADGDGCARLLRDDLDRDALLLERLGASMYDVVPDPAPGTTCCATSRPGSGAQSLPTSTCRPVPTRRSNMPTCSRGYGRRRDGRARGRPSTTRWRAWSVAAVLTTIDALCSCTATSMT
jgi:Aminoglycoside/hydroxyurea antibiotic resistance kinase